MLKRDALGSSNELKGTNTVAISKATINSRILIQITFMSIDHLDCLVRTSCICFQPLEQYCMGGPIKPVRIMCMHAAA